MWQTPKSPADLITFTEEILNGKLYFLYSEILISDEIFTISKFLQIFLGKIRKNQVATKSEVSICRLIFYRNTAWKVYKYGVFLVRIFLYSVQIQETTDQKKLRVWTFFTQWNAVRRSYLCENVCQVKFFVTLYLPTKCLLNK